MTPIHELTALQQAAAVRAGELSPVTLVEHCLARIERLDPLVGAFVTVAAEQAVAEAGRAARRSEDVPPLHGVPVAIKDLTAVRGMRTTCGSAVCADRVADADDLVVTRLRAAGAVPLGKTATPEFGLTCYTESAVSPPTRTPWDLTRSAGGSSGGAAAAVAAGLVPAAHGSDGGGSVRIPASACGVFGIKPTRGRISRGPAAPDLFGLVTDGPIARTVRDAAALLDAMRGPFHGDLFAAPPPPGSFLACADRDPGRLRIARRIDPMVPDAKVHPDCAAAFEDASALLEELGHEVVDAPPLFGPELAADFETLWTVLATLDPVDPADEERLQPFTRWLRERGRRVTGTALMRAHARIQAALRRAFAAMDAFDAILSPTLAAPPVPIGHFHEADPAENLRRQHHFTPFAAAYNLSGQPAVNVPLYWNDAGLPIGVMIAGRLGGEGTLISLSAQLEAARPWRDRRPEIWYG
ncbi:amidase [Thermomonospora amylolytica]|uniref:amidase n=1 Tax=Thermomonospora amylolytica TaxID=1411117 RepID=UPI0018E5886A|nr:amidase [Thermomonospora amylolytica]